MSDLVWVGILVVLLILRRHGLENTQLLLRREYIHLVKQDGQGPYVIRKDLIFGLVMVLTLA